MVCSRGLMRKVPGSNTVDVTGMLTFLGSLTLSCSKLPVNERPALCVRPPKTTPSSATTQRYIQLMTERITIAGLFIMAVGLAPASGQGCSDAGVCTAGPIGELHLSSDSAASEPRNFARLTFSIAAGEQGTSIFQVVPELNIGATDRLSFQVKVPYVSASGNLGANSGLGDPVITGSYTFVKQAHQRLDGLLGVKFPANDANAKANDLPLPMPYQTGLGTTDLLFGLNYRFKRITAAIAYQHVLSQGNANGFLHSTWNGSADSASASGYFESYTLERANDAVLRAQYAIPIGKLAVQPGLLAIVHLADDTRGIGEGTTQRITIENSAGLTLNLTVDARYSLTGTWTLEAAYGSPLVTREVRPDGLTRSMVLNLGLRFAF